MLAEAHVRAVAPRKRVELEEVALAIRLVIWETMREYARELGVTGPKRRVWRDDASDARVARRWLFNRMNDTRWAPADINKRERKSSTNSRKQNHVMECH